jgi:hypothetical protein
LSYIDEDLDEPGVGKLFPNSIQRTLYLNYQCPRGDSAVSIELKKAIYTNPAIVEITPFEDPELISADF